MRVEEHEVLRFATVGSVDDGKSTLIGRLLHDSKAIFEDQLEQLEHLRLSAGRERLDLALLTDGLRAEREQGITIDVAYRYFATPRRSFVIADCPGHVEYTRNMVTGVSTADVALLLIDARHGVVEQTRRHSLLTSLLGVPHLVICVNKMDLVGYDADVFDAIRAEFSGFASRLELHDVTFIPISALRGDNIVERSLDMPWYQGPSLLHHLEHLYIASDENLIDVRFPVQCVIDAGDGIPRVAGTVRGGVLRAGDEVVVLPSGSRTTVRSIEVADGLLDEARPPMAVSLVLDDELVVRRGEMICRPHNRPSSGQELEAMVCWLDDQSELQVDRTYGIKHTTLTAQASVEVLRYRLDIHTLQRVPDPGTLAMNEIGRIALRTSAPLHADPYRRNRATGSFILIDEVTHQTVAGGMILGGA